MPLISGALPQNYGLISMSSAFYKLLERLFLSRLPEQFTTWLIITITSCVQLQSSWKSSRRSKRSGTWGYCSHFRTLHCQYPEVHPHEPIQSSRARSAWSASWQTKSRLMRPESSQNIILGRTLYLVYTNAIPLTPKVSLSL